MSFKKCKVVMLPTNEKAPGQTLWLSKSGQLLHTHSSASQNLNAQHLYFLSDEEIKVGDWMFHNLDKKPIQWSGEETETNPNMYGYKKIIATTDSKLSQIVKRDWMGKLDAQSLQDSINNKMPQPSQSFIEKFVEEYNKGNVITEVMVEYENYYASGALQPNLWQLKINPKDNTITIRKVKESWNKEEFMKFGNWCRIHDSKFPNQVWTIQQLFDKWIEENL